MIFHLLHSLWGNHLLSFDMTINLSSFTHLQRKQKLWLRFVKNPVSLVHTGAFVCVHVHMCDTEKYYWIQSFREIYHEEFVTNRYF